MTADTRERRDLAIGWIFSLLLHLGVGAFVVLAVQNSRAGGDTNDTIELSERPVPDEMPEEERPKFGIERGNPAKMTWLGVEQPSPPIDAPVTETEQSAFTIEQAGGAGGAEIVAPEGPRPAEPTMAQAPAQPTPAVMPTPVVEAPSEPVEADPGAPESMQLPAEEIKVETPSATEGEFVLDEQALPTSDETRDPDALDPLDQDDLPEDLEPAEEQKEAQAEQQEPTPMVEPSPAQPAVQPQPESGGAPVMGEPGEGEGRGTPGVQGEGEARDVGVASNKESIATVKEKALRVEMDNLSSVVQAGEGIEIITKRPQFNTIPKLAGISRNPYVVLRFKADGKPSYPVEFLKGDKGEVYSSGNKDIDFRLIAALYEWRARGRQIDELAGKGPDARVELVVRVILR